MSLLNLIFNFTDSSMEIYVSAMDNPSKFWVQAYGKGTLELDDLIYKMTKYYENKENAELHVLKNVNYVFLEHR